jgi:lipid-A-disaccharide synthase
MSRGEPAGRTAIVVVAGEASGDVHGAALGRALTALVPDVRLVGMGGPLMAAAGVRLLADVRDTAVIGFSEVIRRLPAVRRAYRGLRALLRDERPSAVVLIDFPGMNLRLARAARRAGIPVVYFVPPQVWAWHAGRVRAIRERVSLVLAVFPFERSLYEAAGVPVRFVGHPVLDAMARAPERGEARRLLGLGAEDLVVGLLPGSRRQEIDRMLPVMRDAAGRLAAARPGVRFVLGLAPTVDAVHVGRQLDGGPPVLLARDATHAVMRAADLLLVTSGTATLEAALLGTPMVVCYRVSRASQLLGRLVLRIPWISLVNITLGRTVVPELYLHREATADRLAGTALGLLDDPAALAEQRQAFGELAGQLGEPGVAERAARIVLSVAGQDREPADGALRADVGAAAAGTDRP